MREERENCILFLIESMSASRFVGVCVVYGDGECVCACIEIKQTNNQQK